MKKNAKFGCAILSVIAVSALTGCGNKTSDNIVDKDYVLQEPGTLPEGEGYISLKNTRAIPEIGEDGRVKIGNESFAVNDTYKSIYQEEIGKDKMNYLTNQWTYNSYHYCNMVDGLVENDNKGNIVGAIALGYKVSDDGTVWTFKLRKNAEWIDNKTGKRWNDKMVTAHDFVTAAKYVLNPNNGSGTTGMYTNFIKGADEYYKDNKKDFDQTVGVKALDDYTLQYTLIDNIPYFLSVLTYSPYLPVNQEYLSSKGTDFGQSVNDILANGAFRITTHTTNQKIVYTKNYHYYDRNHVYFDHAIRTFVSASSPLNTARSLYEAGTIDNFTVQEKDADGWTTYVAGKDKTGSLKNPISDICNSKQSYYGATYFGFFNFNRTKYAYNALTAEGTGVDEISCKATTDDQRKDAFLAKINKNFRLGFLHGLNVLEYLKLYSSSSPKDFLARNYTNKELVSAGEKGDYTNYVLDEYNSNQTEETKKVKSLIGIDDSENPNDPVYDTTQSKEFFKNAYNELKAKKSDIAFPIVIDYIGSMKSENQTYEKEMIKSIQANSVIKVNGHDVQLIKINYNIPKTSDENKDWGSISHNFDYSMWQGWGPDYADPQTYMHTCSIYGDLMDSFGLPTSESACKSTVLCQYASDEYSNLVKTEGEIKDYTTAMKKLQEDVLGAYNTEYEKAVAVTETVARYEAFAKAEYKLIYEEAIINPWYSKNGYYAQVSKALPLTLNKSSYGICGDEHKYKNIIVTDHAITKNEKAAIQQWYDAN